MTATPRVRVLVTRPKAQAAVWVERLRDRGIDAEALPLIEIVPIADAAPVHAAWRAIRAFRLVVFVSANAVEQFFAARPPDAVWPAGVDAGAPGPGTAEALRAAGCRDAVIVSPSEAATQFDSEALWERLQARDWHGTRVLVVRGEGGREWLVDRFVDAGARVETVAAYRRVPPSFIGAERERLEAAAAASDETVWLFSSSEAIANLVRAAGSGRWRNARAIATHPRIAARARILGFGHVVEVSAGVDAVVACIQSNRP